MLLRELREKFREGKSSEIFWKITGRNFEKKIIEKGEISVKYPISAKNLKKPTTRNFGRHCRRNLAEETQREIPRGKIFGKFVEKIIEER